jgi:hypothetical protein
MAWNTGLLLHQGEGRCAEGPGISLGHQTGITRPPKIESVLALGHQKKAYQVFLKGISAKK